MGRGKERGERGQGGEGRKGWGKREQSKRYVIVMEKKKGDYTDSSTLTHYIPKPLWTYLEEWGGWGWGREMRRDKVRIVS